MVGRVHLWIGAYHEMEGYFLISHMISCSCDVLQYMSGICLSTAVKFMVYTAACKPGK